MDNNSGGGQKKRTTLFAIGPPGTNQLLVLVLVLVKRLAMSLVGLVFVTMELVWTRMTEMTTESQYQEWQWIMMESDRCTAVSFTQGLLGRSFARQLHIALGNRFGVTGVAEVRYMVRTAKLKSAGSHRCDMPRRRS